MNIARAVLLASAVYLLAPVGPVHAQAITSPGDPALAGASVIDFSSVTVGNYPSFSVADVVFSAMVGGETLRVAPYGEGGVFNHTGNHLQNDSGRTAGFRFDFTTPVTAFGFNYGAANAFWSLTVFDIFGTVLGTATIHPGNGLNGFIGFADAQGRIATAKMIDGGDWLQMDDLHYVKSTVAPEPASIVLLGIGLTGVGVLRRRRRREIETA